MSDHGTVTSEGLNLRSAPSFKPGNILDQLKRGDRVEIVHRIIIGGNDWLRVKYHNEEGYVAATFVKLDPKPATETIPHIINPPPPDFVPTQPVPTTPPSHVAAWCIVAFLIVAGFLLVLR